MHIFLRLLLLRFLSEPDGGLCAFDIRKHKNHKYEAGRFRDIPEAVF